MELIFKSNGDTHGFVNWLKSFKEIQDSLLIECDLKESIFVSKAFTADHSVVKYNKISFEEAGFEVLNVKDNDDVAYSIDEWNEKYDVRIKVGIFMILGKFISVNDIFKDTEYKLTIKFDVYRDSNGGKDEFHAQDIRFKSKTNSMKVKDCNISEFEQLDDDIFFTRINVITNPMSFEIPMDVIKNLTSISSVFSSDKKDVIKFYTKLDEDKNKFALYAKDNINETYDYLLGYITDGEPDENAVLLYRNNFFTAVNLKGSDENIIITMDSDVDKKMRIETSNKTMYTVLSTVVQ